jgi:transcriptional antiterminator NusG
MDLRKFDSCWFAVQVKAKCESMAATILRNKGYEEYTPTVTTREVHGRDSAVSAAIERPLYPGYIFCRFNSEVRGPIVTTPGVIRVVGTPTQPIPITDEEMANVRLATSAGLPASPVPYICAGTRIVITGGPLQGVQGLFVRKNKSNRLIVSIDLIQRSLAVEIDSSWVGSFNQPAAA